MEEIKRAAYSKMVHLILDNNCVSKKIGGGSALLGVSHFNL
jgi:hypothetical protein